MINLNKQHLPFLKIKIGALFSKNFGCFKYLSVLVMVLMLGVNGVMGQVYLHNFGTTIITTKPYTGTPTTLAPNISNSSWTTSSTGWSGLAGSAGMSLSLANSSGTPTYTLTFDIASGYQLSITSFNFWRVRSTTGAQNWTMTINGTSVGSGTVPTSGAALGSTSVSSSISGLTGTITVILSLSGASSTGTFRLDDFTLNGSVTSSSTTATLAPYSSQLSGNIAKGASNVPLTGFTISNSASGDFTGVTYTNIGTATTSDLSNFRIFRDFNGDGIINTIGGTDANVSGSGLALSGSNTFNITGETGFTTARSYLLVADVAGGATPSRTITSSSNSFTTSLTTATGSVTGNSRSIAGVAPALTAAVGATVDGAFVVTFSDDATWRAAITSVTIGGTTLTAGYSVSSGQITFTPSASSPTNLLQGSGSKSIVINATGYTGATVTQSVGFGAATKLGITTQPTAPLSNGAVLVAQPVVAIQDQYENTVNTDNTTVVTAVVSTGSWTIGGTTSRTAVSGVATFTNLTATSAAAVVSATVGLTSSPSYTSTTSTPAFAITAPPPANDDCSNAVTLTIGASATSGTNVLATKSSPSTFTALSNYTNTNPNPDVWYSFTPTCSGTHTITVTPSSIDVVMAVFGGGSCPNPTYITHIDAGTSGVAESYTFVATQGTIYSVMVFGYSGATGSFTIGVNTPTLLVTTNAASSITTTGATLNGNTTTLCPNITEIGFVYSLTNANNNPLNAGTGVTKVSVTNVEGAFTNTLTGLTTGVSYSYKAYAYNGSTYTYGGVQTFTPANTPVTIYQNPFESGTLNTPTYTGGTTTLANNLSNSMWRIGSGTLQLFGGSSGNALGTSSTSSTPYTLTFTVANGYQLSVSSYSYWRQTSSSGTASVSSITINGTTITSGAIAAPQSNGTNSGITNVANTVSDLTGTITVVINITGSGSFRLDDFTLNGNVTAIPAVAFSNTQFTAAINIIRGTTELPIYRFQVGLTNAAATLNSLTFTTPADGVNSNYVNTDITAFKAFLTTSTTFSNTNQLGLTANSFKTQGNLGETGIAFTSLNKTLNVDTTYYIWLTANVLNAATSGRTLVVNAPTVSITGNVTGTNSATGTQTIQGVATNYYLNTGGSLTTNANYFTSPNGVGATLSAAGLTYQSNDVTLNIPISVTNSGDITLGNGSKIVVQNGGSLTVGSLNTITGTIDVNDGGTLIFNNSTTSSTLGTLGNTSSTVIYSASGAQAVQNKTYANLSIGGSGVKTVGTTTVTGTLTQSGTATLGTASPILTGATLAYVDNTNSQAYTAGLEWPNTNGPSNVTVNLSGSGSASLTLGGSRTVSGTLALSSGKLAIGAGNTLTLNGDLTCDANNSIITTATSNITLAGNAKTLYFDASNNSLKNLDITGSNTMTLGNTLNITGGSSFGVVTVGSGAILNANGNLTLKSDANGTAGIGNSAGTISGNVTVERYIASAGRRWRFLSSPVQGKTIADWRNQFCVTGPGTITNSTVGDLNSNGWHQTYNNITNSTAATTTSVRLFMEANSTSGNLNLGWGNVSTSTPLTAGQGFRAFVRGPITDKVNQLDANGNTYTQAAVTVALTGTINAGNISAPSLTNSQTGWNLLGNPYPCAYDYNTMFDANISSEIANIDPNVYVYNGVTNSYTSYNASSNTGGLTDGIIPSGAGFFVKATGSPVFVFKETYKTTTAPISLHKTAISSVDFGMKYYKDGSESDFMIIKMFDGATLNNEMFDTKKIVNENLNLSAYGTDDIDLMASCIPFVTEETRIKLKVEAAVAGTYKFDFTNMDHFDAGVSVSLLDKYTNTTIDIKKNSKYTFEMGAGVNQWGKNRFELILNLEKTGVDEFALLNKTHMLVYPNPATDLLNINISNSSFKNAEVVVYNISGTEVLKTNMTANNAQLNIETLSNGVYFVKVSNQNGFNKTVKFVK